MPGMKGSDCTLQTVRAIHQLRKCATAHPLEANLHPGSFAKALHRIHT